MDENSIDREKALQQIGMGLCRCRESLKQLRRLMFNGVNRRHRDTPVLESLRRTDGPSAPSCSLALLSVSVDIQSVIDASHVWLPEMAARFKEDINKLQKAAEEVDASLAAASANVRPSLDPAVAWYAFYSELVHVADRMRDEVALIKAELSSLTPAGADATAEHGPISAGRKCDVPSKDLLSLVARYRDEKLKKGNPRVTVDMVRAKDRFRLLTFSKRLKELRDRGLDDSAIMAAVKTWRLNPEKGDRRELETVVRECLNLLSAP